jgi:hypothetical protein
MTINIIDYFILALATYRLTRLVTTDTVFERVREKVWKKFPPHKGGIGYLITCNWCASIWVASLVFSMYKISTEPVIFVSTILSLSVFAGFLSRAG